MKTNKSFFTDEQGQDLIEYTLLLAFVALATAALFSGAGTQLKEIFCRDGSCAEESVWGPMVQALIWIAAGTTLVILLMRRSDRKRG